MAAIFSAQTSVRPFTSAGRATRATVGRPVRLVVRATAQKPQSNPVKAAVEAVRNGELPAFARPAAVATIANILMAMPAHAEAGKIFDFNLTLPIMAGQFLALMVFLDKTWFGPVGRHLEERDNELRSKLGSVKDNSAQLNALQAEAEKTLTEARQEAQKVIQEAKSKTQAECNKQLAETKAKLDKELDAAIASLESEKDAALKDLDSQVSKLSAEILARVLPDGVKL